MTVHCPEQGLENTIWKLSLCRQHQEPPPLLLAIRTAKRKTIITTTSLAVETPVQSTFQCLRPDVRDLESRENRKDTAGSIYRES